MTVREITRTLQEARVEKGYNYRELAIRAGVMPDTAREGCQGIRVPSMGSLQALCAALGLEVVVRRKGA